MTLKWTFTEFWIRIRFQPYVVLTREESFLVAQQLHMPDIDSLHAEMQRTNGVQVN